MRSVRKSDGDTHSEGIHPLDFPINLVGERRTKISALAAGVVVTAVVSTYSNEAAYCGVCHGLSSDKIFCVFLCLCSIGNGLKEIRWVNRKLGCAHWYWKRFGSPHKLKCKRLRGKCLQAADMVLHHGGFLPMNTSSKNATRYNTFLPHHLSVFFYLFQPPATLESCLQVHALGQVFF
jgi:hypothetical protein